MPSYLGAWLFLLALPLGALPILMGWELLDLPETALVAALRRLAAAMPLAAVLAIPVLLRALAQVESKTPWQLRVLGGGPMQAAWQAETKRLGLAERVVFAGKRPYLEAVAEMGSRGS